MEEKKTKKEKKKIEFDSFTILSITVMLVSTAIAIYFLFSFGK
jgi:flagellar basal body-associated protein FliL